MCLNFKTDCSSTIIMTKTSNQTTTNNDQQMITNFVPKNAIPPMSQTVNPVVNEENNIETKQTLGSSHPNHHPRHQKVIRYRITGSAAHSRIQPLLPQHWIDCSPHIKRNNNSMPSRVPYNTTTTTKNDESSISFVSRYENDGNDNDDNNINSSKQNKNDKQQSVDIVEDLDFVWENALRFETKRVRNHLKCYSHLPNGTNILDSKWVLGRLLSLSSPPAVSPRDDPGDPIKCLAVLKTHCFRGRNGFDEFVQKVSLLSDDTTSPFDEKIDDSRLSNIVFRDLDPICDQMVLAAQGDKDCLNNNQSVTPNPSQNHRNNDHNKMWVIKDSMSNGAGGIWILDHTNMTTVRDKLHDEHSYVAQKYVSPSVLYQRRKCHVRVYGVICSDGCSYVHNQCFLHVANDIYPMNGTIPASNGLDCNVVSERDATTHTAPIQAVRFPDSVHITNCCANSHDKSKFSGEILANLDQHGISSYLENPTTDEENKETTKDELLVIGLAPFRPSIEASFAELTKKMYPFVDDGQSNGGFEYVGMDFMLSYSDDDEIECSSHTTKRVVDKGKQPVAYLLEVNAPPSQDTATGLWHAEKLHDTVIRDLITLWIIPKVEIGTKPIVGGWRLVYNHNQDTTDSVVTSTEMNQTVHMPYSKAVILNKIRWSLYERKHLADEEQLQELSTKESSLVSTVPFKSEYGCTSYNIQQKDEDFANYARQFFPYYHLQDQTNLNSSNQESGCSSTEVNKSQAIFFENAGGSQVPQVVINSMISSLSNRHRDVLGAQSKNKAIDTLHTLLGTSRRYNISFGANATSVLCSLAQQYSRSGYLKDGDEIILSIENHVANTVPWIDLAESVGALIVWWSPPKGSGSSRNDLENSIRSVLSSKTRLICFPHVSNILGSVNDVGTIRDMIDQVTGRNVHLVVDGVSAVPHIFPNLKELDVDWYVISCHKWFGPHLGVLCGKNETMSSIVPRCTEVPTSTAGEYPFNGGGIQNNNTKFLEVGTINYEACEGIVGLGNYFHQLSKFGSRDMCERRSISETMKDITEVDVLFSYDLIQKAEGALVEILLRGIKRSSKIRIIGQDCSVVDSNSKKKKILKRLPIVSFVHSEISSSYIVEQCYRCGIVCRHGTFLASERLLNEYNIQDTTMNGGVVRFSLLHYNTVSEITNALFVLESIPHWF